MPITPLGLLPFHPRILPHDYLLRFRADLRLPLVVTAITLGTGQTLHTAIAGAGVPQRIQISAFNLDTLLSHNLTVAIWAVSGLTPIATYTIALPRNVGQYAVLDPNFINIAPELVLNGASFITVWADTASKIAVSARVNDQAGVAAFTAGSGQTSGLPLLIPTTYTKGTLPTANTGTLLHTAPTGTNTPNVIQLSAINSDPVNERAVAVGIFAAGTTAPLVVYQINLPIGEGIYQILDPKALTNLVLNGAAFIQVWADVANVVSVMANVNTQTGSGGTSTTAQLLSSGLVAGVISAARYAMFQSGGTGQTTEANAQIMVPGPGSIHGLSAVSSATMGAGSSVTCVLRQNGAATTQTRVTLTSANGTTRVTTTGAAVTVAAGDLIDFEVVETLGVAPVANFQVTAELVLTG